MGLVCGIDEAGRGPLIGPIVLAGVLIEEEKAVELKKLGVKDSKLLTPSRRKALFGKIIAAAADYKIVIIPPEEIDEAVLGGKGGELNLNWLEADHSAAIISLLKPSPDKAIIDSPSNNCEAYKKHLQQLLRKIGFVKEIELIVEHKADVNWPVVSAASILAKVTRDEQIEKIKEFVVEDFGSGYLTDQKTVEFFEKYFNVYPDIFRKSWATYKDKLTSKQQRKLEDFDH